MHKGPLLTSDLDQLKAFETWVSTATIEILNTFATEQKYANNFAYIAAVYAGYRNYPQLSAIALTNCPIVADSYKKYTEAIQYEKDIGINGTGLFGYYTKYLHFSGQEQTVAEAA